ncbi:dihydrodipicolinate synthase family protein [Herbaspirillum sp. WKF16]|uniref:dihydrodipicolinate synthase family protein n=1 Tax=Herbaspirillum sp. WKF16 TaxID=3028312 RepID=UPI0023A9B1E1|nr:dihydrodipicolinate synthase family protein [Herbaspirillum sp. WKF16]WDZ95062.1 dihydrodipicolinate synthase family protein [Herbaspirillum sp. WKF16]
MSATQPPRIKGVLSPVLTPFGPDLEPDARAFVAHCRWLVRQGAGLAVFGTNSEANSLSADERIALTDALLESGVPPALLMPGTGTCALPDTVRLTRHAVRAGAAGVLMLPPFYYKNVSDDGLFAYFSEVIERVGESRLAVYLYHFPAMSATPVSLALIERLLKRYPGTIAGVKDSSGDWANMEAMIRNFGQDGFDVFPGAETFLNRAIEAGGAGCISATVNVNPAAIVAIWRSEDAQQRRLLQDRADAIRKIFQSQPMIPAMKHAIAHWSGRRDWRTVRPPLAALSDTAGAALAAQLEAAGFGIPDAHELA